MSGGNVSYLEKETNPCVSLALKQWGNKMIRFPLLFVDIIPCNSVFESSSQQLFNPPKTRLSARLQCMYVCTCGLLRFEKPLGKKCLCSDLSRDIFMSWVAIYRTTAVTQSTNSGEQADTHHRRLAQGQI